MNFFNLTQIPAPVRGLLLFAAGGSLLGLLFSFDARIGFIVLTGMFVSACLLAGYHRFLNWRAAKQSKSMSGQIQEHSSAAPIGINDPARRARLDDLKRNFETGLSKFRTSGKDVYKLPWYLIVGEPGSGKTEAVRHCNVGFPPGLQDELQGVGGTINMNWWFTNHAVLLDTAGRLMFEEVKPGETSEWREFLQLLKRNRPDCPVNGLFLVIPADSLIRDTTDAIAKKAGKIAQQLDLIQRTLDIRFPVFVLITKCDLLNGFREFFEELTDPGSQHQMLGWSNPEPRDAIFRPDLVTQHLETVVQRVRKRRLGLLRDPIPQKDGARRADEVDALYGLPQSLALIGPRLRSYLETVFVASEWSAKPLFLRGIYFTSAMREGAALDQELAEAVGVSLDDLPDGKAWERERAYFLRDLFMEKAFRERGLVTRASNTSKLLRQRQLYLYGSGLLAFALLLAFSFFGYQALRESIGKQSDAWAKARDGWNAGRWHPIIERNAHGSVIYKGDQPTLPSEKTTLLDYHQALRELCESEIKVSWVFRPLAKFAGLEGDRKKAQRIVFEGSVISPLVKEARRSMIDEANAPLGSTAGMSARILREAEALAALIAIESDFVSGGSDVDRIPQAIFLPLTRYATGLDAPLDAANLQKFSGLVTWVYTKNPNGHWPPPWISAGTSLAENKPISAGLDRLLAYASENLKTQESGLADIRSLRDKLRAYHKKEIELNAMALSPDERTRVYNAMRTLNTDLGSCRQELDRAVKDAVSRGTLSAERMSVFSAYQRLVGESQSQSKDAFDIVEKSVASYVAKPADSVNSAHPIFVQVDAKLSTAAKDFTTRLASSFSAQERDELQELDPLLGDFGNGKRNYEVRSTAYDSAFAQLTIPDKTGNLLGQNWAALRELDNHLSGQSQTVSGLKDKLTEPFSAACKYFLDRAREIRVDRILRAYVDQTRSAFERGFHYPIVREPGSRNMSRKDLAEASRLVDVWKSDLTSENYRNVLSFQKQKLDNFLNDILPIKGILGSLDGSVTVNLMSYGQAPDKDGLNHFRKVIVRGHGEQDTSNDRISDSFGFFDSFDAEFLDYSVTPRKSSALRMSGLELLNKARGSGRLVVYVDKFPIWLEVSADRQPPDLSALPDKQKVLANLN